MRLVDWRDMIQQTTTFDGLDALRFDNEHYALEIVVGMGPRITSFSRASGGGNILGEARDSTIETGLGVWRAIGGHRLWFAPEVQPRTYAPDNDAVEWEEIPDGVALRRPADKATGIAREISVRMEADGVLVAHRLRNDGLWEVELAPWALTIMCPGGEAILPQEPHRPHAESLLPKRSMAIWSYTDLADPRLALGGPMMRIRTISESLNPVKIGINNRSGWAAYRRRDQLFVKRFDYLPGSRYPDLGCNCEVYTAGDFLELESLGPLERLAPGESAEHIERWELHTLTSIDPTADEILAIAQK